MGIGGWKVPTSGLQSKGRGVGKIDRLSHKPRGQRGRICVGKAKDSGWGAQEKKGQPS